MTPNHNKKLMAKVFIVGMVIAVLGYLFHPEVGQLSVMVNGEPVAEPFVRFAAIPTFLIIMGLALLLTLLLLMGFGVLMCFGALFFALTVCFVIAPYFWPVLVIVVLIIALMSYQHDNPE